MGSCMFLMYVPTGYESSLVRGNHFIHARLHPIYNNLAKSFVYSIVERYWPELTYLFRTWDFGN